MSELSLGPATRLAEDAQGGPQRAAVHLGGRRRVGLERAARHHLELERSEPRDLVRPLIDGSSGNPEHFRQLTDTPKIRNRVLLVHASRIARPNRTFQG